MGSVQVRCKNASLRFGTHGASATVCRSKSHTAPLIGKVDQVSPVYLMALAH